MSSKFFFSREFLHFRSWNSVVRVFVVELDPLMSAPQKNPYSPDGEGVVEAEPVEEEPMLLRFRRIFSRFLTSGKSADSRSNLGRLYLNLAGSRFL